MTTNRTTRSPKGSVPSTSDSNSPFGTSVATEVGATTPGVRGAAATNSDVPKPRRPGTKSFSASVAAREAADEAFAARMASARARIAPDLYDAPLTLAALRLSKGLSQTALAARLGTSQSHIAKIESGKLRIQFETAAALADALDISLDTLRPMICRVPRKGG